MPSYNDIDSIQILQHHIIILQFSFSKGSEKIYVRISWLQFYGSSEEFLGRFGIFIIKSDNTPFEKSFVVGGVNCGYFFKAF